MQFLGNTLTSIASEKAGIIKPNVLAVIGETNQESATVFIEKAQQEQAVLFFADQHYQAKIVKEDLQNTYYDVYHEGQLRFQSLPVNLHANYQVFNLQTVLQAVDCLPKAWNITEEALKSGLKNLVASTRFIGRWQILHQEPTIIADSAHNEAGLELAMKELAKISHKQLHLVIGVLKDKDLSKMLPLLPTEGVYYFAKPNIPRGMEAAELQQAALESGRKGKVYSSVRNAYKAARRHAQPEDVVYVGGSIFVLAEIL
jgi:dihydrofolate synthase/folylpolyglutamate synthase